MSGCDQRWGLTSGGEYAGYATLGPEMRSAAKCLAASGETLRLKSHQVGRVRGFQVLRVLDVVANPGR
jgi:hypothetical protein